MEETRMSKITIQDFAERLAERKGMNVSDAQRFLTAMLDTINEGLNDEKVVKIKGFGTFKVIDVKQRKSIDVNTGEEIMIEGRGKITFTPDSVMRDLVNKPFSQFETVVLNEGVDFSEIDSLDEKEEEPTVVEDTIDEEEVKQEQQEKEEVQTPTEVELPVEHIASLNEEPEEYVSEESFSEALLVLDYINGKELPKEKPMEEAEEELLDSTEEAISDALFAVHSLDINDVKADESDVPAEEVEVEASQEPVEQPAVNMLSEEPIVIDEPVKDDLSDEEIIEEEPSNAWKRWLIAIALIAVVGLLSYYCIDFFNKKEALASEELNNNETIAANQEPVVAEVSDSVALADSLAMLKREKEIEDSITAAAIKDKAIAAKVEANAKAEAKQETAKPEQKVQKPATAVVDKELEYAKRLVHYGAYNIVGTDRVITVKKGQTMTSVAKTYLGKDMACYIEVHNGTTKLIEGQKLNIPKLQIKKKSKNK